MKDFEVFAQYWNEAVNGLVYGIQKCEDALLSKSRVQAIWTEELLTKRFRSEGVLHGSRQFLDELAQQEPEKANQIIGKLELSEMPLGLETADVAGKAGGAVAAAAASFGSKNIIAKLGLLAASGGLAYSAFRSADQGRKSTLIQAVQEEANRQLQEFKVLFGS